MTIAGDAPSWTWTCGSSAASCSASPARTGRSTDRRDPRRPGGGGAQVDRGRLDAHAPIQDRVDLDSMDVPAPMEAVRVRTGIEVPESDHRRLATIADGARCPAVRIA